MTGINLLPTDVISIRKNTYLCKFWPNSSRRCGREMNSAINIIPVPSIPESNAKNKNDITIGGVAFLCVIILKYQNIRPEKDINIISLYKIMD
jgi:hypothetical protein